MGKKGKCSIARFLIYIIRASMTMTMNISNYISISISIFCWTRFSVPFSFQNILFFKYFFWNTKMIFLVLRYFLNTIACNVHKLHIKPITKISHID